MAQHIHKYRRIDIGKKKQVWVMQCSLPKCSHYIHMDTKLSVPSLVGKIAICNKCEHPFELDRMALQKAEPVCRDCVKSPNKDKINKAAQFFSKLEGDLGKGILDELEE